MGCKYVKDFEFPSSGKTQVRGYYRGGPPKAQAKVGKVMGEYKAGELHSGSKTGPVVKNPKQAVAIALSEARRSVPGMKRRK